MKQLTKAEEQVMKYLWKLEKAFLKDIIEAFPEPRPANTTIATLINRMIDKGFIGFNRYSKIREYYPKMTKTEYFGKQINSIIKDFFNNSASQFASFFTDETNLSIDELEELKKIVENKINQEKEDEA
nr:BlaI/MecI/CopY family transcriptional regulator [uncultured Draconibacterium sp.]